MTTEIKVDYNQNYKVEFTLLDEPKRTLWEKTCTAFKYLQDCSRDFIDYIKTGDALKQFEHRFQKDKFWSYTAPLVQVFMTAHPSIIEALLKQERNGDFFGSDADSKQPSKVNLHTIMKDIFGEKVAADDFILSAHKEMAQKLREPISCELEVEKIIKKYSFIEQIVKETITEWIKEFDSNNGKKPINVSELNAVFTTSIISKLLIGYKGSQKDYKEVANAINYFITYIHKKDLYFFVSAETESKYQESVKTVRKAIADNIENNELAYKLKNQGLTDIQIKTTLFSAFFAGIHTSSALLNYIMWQLGQRKDIQSQIRYEAKENEDLSFVTSSKLIDSIFKESIRLYPPVYVNPRHVKQRMKCTVKDINNGEIINEQIFEKGQIILISSFFTARLESYFKDPNTFNPNRFYENKKNVYKWVPFGKNAHPCPGQYLATTEIKMLMAELCKRCEFESLPTTEPEIGSSFTLFLRQDVLLNLKKV